MWPNHRTSARHSRKLPSASTSYGIAPPYHLRPDLAPALVIHCTPFSDLGNGAHAANTKCCTRIDPANAYAGRRHGCGIDIQVSDQMIEIFRARWFPAHDEWPGAW